VGGRWGRNRSQDSGFRIQVTSIRAGAMLNYELWVASRLLASGHRGLPSACLRHDVTANREGKN
jgi:hypothetical protein